MCIIFLYLALLRQGAEWHTTTKLHVPVTMSKLICFTKWRVHVPLSMHVLDTFAYIVCTMQASFPSTWSRYMCLYCTLCMKTHVHVHVHVHVGFTYTCMHVHVYNVSVYICTCTHPCTCTYCTHMLHPRLPPCRSWTLAWPVRQTRCSRWPPTWWHATTVLPRSLWAWNTRRTVRAFEWCNSNALPCVDATSHVLRTCTCIDTLVRVWILTSHHVTSSYMYCMYLSLHLSITTYAHASYIVHVHTVDIWSVGCIFAEMVKGEILLPGRDCILYCKQQQTWLMYMYM